ncbi:MAG TPA: HAMP domain-containing protein [Candidatus Acidoferrales bacterium]|nr:HAMP domain-containing protein [Candidatus Acidoferrales bacterium]
MDHDSRRLSLRWKIGGTFAAMVMILGLLAVVAVYQLTTEALRAQFDQRIFVMANNLSDAAAGPMAGRNPLATDALVNKYARLDGVAYAFIEDGKGEIVAHTLGNFPAELKSESTAGGQRQVYRRELSWNGKAVYETIAPILEGQMGSVHIGFWADPVEKETQRILLPILGIIASLSLVGALLSFFLAHLIIRPIVGLTQIADKVTMGDLETSVSGKCVTARDEIGDLARSLERMRSSLKAAMLRLGRETA